MLKATFRTGVQAAVLFGAVALVAFGVAFWQVETSVRDLEKNLNGLVHGLNELDRDLQGLSRELRGLQDELQRLDDLLKRTEQTLPAEAGVTVERKSDLAPVPQPSCKTPFSEVSRSVPGWRVLTNEKAVIYVASSLKPDTRVPNFDSVAYLKSGPIITVLVLNRGCVLGRFLLPQKTHDRAMERATGVIV